MDSMISLFGKRARTKAGASDSVVITGTTPLTAETLITDAWSPTLYRLPHRLQANFKEAHVAAFDIDDGMTLDEAITKVAHLKHLIGTTASHQQQKGEKGPCDRFRVVLFLERPATTVEEYKETIRTLASNLALTADKACMDAARWFTPCTAVVSANAEGSLCPVKAVQAVVRNTAPPLAHRNTVQAPPLAHRNVKGSLSRATLAFLAQVESDDAWHLRFYKAAVDLKEQGYSQEEAEQRLRLASPVGELDATDLHQLEDVYQNRGGALGMRDNWPDMVKRRDGTLVPDPQSIKNLTHLLTVRMGLTFSQNRRSGLVHMSLNGKRSEPINDSDLSLLNTEARAARLPAGEAVRDLVSTLARQNSYDPITDPLTDLKWDGKDHIRALFETIVLLPDVTEEQRGLYYQYLRRWILAIVNKIQRPGSENNVLIFQGEQAAGKSRWLKRLASLWPNEWGEGHISPDNKDHELRHLDVAIWHVAEFDSTTSRREVGALKDFFTKDTVNVRRPYSRTAIVGRSVCSFCASVNSFDFLRDNTGNRRYLVIPIRGLNVDHSVSIEQVFAEAKAALANGERHWFSQEEIKTVNEQNESFISNEEYIDIIQARAIPGNDPMTIRRMMTSIGFADERITTTLRSNIRTILERKAIRTRKDNAGRVFFIDAEALTGKAAGIRGLVIPKGVS